MCSISVLSSELRCSHLLGLVLLRVVWVCYSGRQVVWVTAGGAVEPLGVVWSLFRCLPSLDLASSWWPVVLSSEIASSTTSSRTRERYRTTSSLNDLVQPPHSTTTIQASYASQPRVSLNPTMRVPVVARSRTSIRRSDSE
jgi:hypothetical protein